MEGDGAGDGGLLTPPLTPMGALAAAPAGNVWIGAPAEAPGTMTTTPESCTGRCGA
jgi:hypothetical protein